MSYDISLYVPLNPICRVSECAEPAIWEIQSSDEHDEALYYSCVNHVGSLLDPEAWHDYILTTINHHDEVVEIGNMTSNVSGMWYLALGGVSLSEYKDKQAKGCIADFERAVAHMDDPENRSTYEAMNPKNGWGSFEGAKSYLSKLLNACREYPEAFIYISY